MNQIGTMADAVVVGGGLAGLTAAAYLARAGERVMVVEQARDLGGRARTNHEGGFSFNLGPHAVYLAGAGAQVLRELNIPFPGGQPGGGSFLFSHGRLHTLPEGFVSLASTGLFGLREKLELAGLMTRIQRVETDSIAHVRFADWLAAEIETEGVRELLTTLIRVATYTHPTQDMSAGAAIRQLQLASNSGVRYVDGGWQTLVDALRNHVLANGGEIVTGRAVRSVAQGVVLDDGTTLNARSVILAGSPGMVAYLTGIREWEATRVPVHAACLDVALRSLPHSGNRAAFGMQEPLYASVHSAVARLAPDGGALVHIARYGGLQGRDPQHVREELEDLLDRLQPGWRAHVVKTRFLPGLTVSHAAVLAAQGGLAGRPPVAVQGRPGLFLAGDWVGSEGMLADASFASGRRAAQLARHTPRPEEAHALQVC
ncbi:MAG: NAD(P)/FAD-dependent oxidoreductase [Bryobacterales bacterium]|nr:NAD(P)/FAD-dependent oxidoreductase [Bryobacterales bacterium]